MPKCFSSTFVLLEQPTRTPSHFKMSSLNASPTSPTTSSPTSPKSPRLPSFAQLVNDKLDRHIHVHPRDLTCIRSVRELREEGVLKIIDAIRECGWACSTLYASDRGDGKLPVLVDGSHRLEALRRLLKSKDTSWLLQNETPENFKVTLTVLKGLTFEEEGRVGREANHINSRHVSMTLVDHIVATHRAVIATRLRLNLKSGEDLSSETLRKVHPDFRRYANSTIRAWKGLAEGLSPQARKLLLQVHASGLSSGDVRVAFSKKTLVDSKMMHHLRNCPGAQFWYLKRLVNLEDNDEIRTHKAPYFEDLILVLKSFSNACTQFVGRLKYTFKLTKVARYLDDIVQTGTPSDNLRPALKVYLTTFAHNYLWTSKRDKEVHALLQLRKKNIKMYPYVFYQLVAQLHFKEDYEKVDKMFAAPQSHDRVTFTSPVDPTQENLAYRQLLHNRRRKLRSSSLGQSLTEEQGPPRKKQKNSAEQGKEITKNQKQVQDEHEEVEEIEVVVAEEDEAGEEDGEDQVQDGEEDKESDQSDQSENDEEDDEEDDEENMTLAAKKSKGETKSLSAELQKDSAHPLIFKTSVSLNIYQAQSSTLASTLLHDINKLLEQTKVPPGERITLSVQQKGKPAVEKSFN